MQKTYHGSCHCGAIRFEADIDLTAETGKCNCSICTKRRNWGALLKPEAFRLLSGAEMLNDYSFGTGQGSHRFCRTCGCAPFSQGDVPEIGGAFVSVQLGALDDATDEELAAVPVKYSDGRNNAWWNAPAVTSYL
ncbi:GFA family protein [Sphingomonas sp. DG1-23]|jgi:hypothetical protein|uniref:GFA family protein n=1 Tax=Sphingomonas sp. DG1-23 TaxID=3068316 RepID=UPI00273F4B2C|nr:GFA family protein [Sphingomonas sp. DG1-23]MDP5277394.1 GFA family protein [Sphingomonas sp. DG1-23]